MRRVVIVANSTPELPQELKRVLGTMVRYTEDKSTIRVWRDSLKEPLKTIYNKALQEGLIRWNSMWYSMPGSYSVNAYRAGRRGRDAQRQEQQWQLQINDKPKPVDVLKDKSKSPSSDYTRCRYMWKNFSNVFNEWEKGFAKSIGEQLSKAKPLTLTQKASLEKMFKKYKIKEDAVASSDGGTWV